MGEKSVLKGDEKVLVKKQKTELADAHCHLDLIKDQKLISDAVLHGVHTIITNGVDFKSSKRALELCDSKHIFPAIGIDPENAMKISDDELDYQIELVVAMIKGNKGKIVSVGEIGLDYTKAKSFELVAKQRTVFERMLDAAKEQISFLNSSVVVCLGMFARQSAHLTSLFTNLFKVLKSCTIIISYIDNNCLRSRT